MKLKDTALKISLALGVLIVGLAGTQGQTNLGLGLQMYAGLTVTGLVGHVYEIQATANANDPASWDGIAAVTLPEFPQPYLFFTPASASRGCYRSVYRGVAPANMALIPAGLFTMGDTFPDEPASELPSELPAHTVFVSAFFMDRYEVTKELWDYVKIWAEGHGYAFDNPGLGKSANHPVHTVSWYDVVKWCNARSEMEGRIPAYYQDAAQTFLYRTGQVDVAISWVKWSAGYRLPTEAEWEKAARGGLNGKRFPWGDTITHSLANYCSYYVDSYDISPTRGYHPVYHDGTFPNTSPAGSFAANGYGLYDMVGNVWNWCWDWYAGYSSATQANPRGPTSGAERMFRGGCWASVGCGMRTAHRGIGAPTYKNYYTGFRSVLPPGQ